MEDKGLGQPYDLSSNPQHLRMKEGTNSNYDSIRKNHNWQRQTFGHPS